MKGKTEGAVFGEVLRFLGLPGTEELAAMHPSPLWGQRVAGLRDSLTPPPARLPLEGSLLPVSADGALAALLDKLLRYSPAERPCAIAVAADPFFKPLWNPDPAVRSALPPALFKPFGAGELEGVPVHIADALMAP